MRMMGIPVRLSRPNNACLTRFAALGAGHLDNMYVTSDLLVVTRSTGFQSSPTLHEALALIKSHIDSGSSLTAVVAGGFQA